MYHFVYKTTRYDGMYYIGVHSTINLEDGYLGSGTRFLNSIRKHGKEAHFREILAVFDTREEALIAEAALVNEETLKDPLCLNLVLGGASLTENGINRLRTRVISDETRRKMSIAAQKRGIKEETKIKISKALTGIQKGPMSQETKHQLSKSRKEMFAERQALGIKTELSDSHRESLRQARLGKSLSDETKEKISIAKSKPTHQKWMIHKDHPPRRVNQEDVSRMLSLGWKFGRKL